MQSSRKWQASMRYMYELMQRKMSKENAALLTAALVLVGISIFAAGVITILGLWIYADILLSVIVLVSGLALLIWILNL